MIDIQETHKKFRKELSAGTVSLALLSILAQAEEPLYGYQIGKLVGAGGANAEADSVMVKQGAIYPVLRSLESQDLLSSEREILPGHRNRGTSPRGLDPNLDSNENLCRQRAGR